MQFSKKLINTLAIDFGEERTGIAIAEFYNVAEEIKINIFSPHFIISSNREALITNIVNYIKQYQVKQIVLGILPPRADGKKRRITIMAEKLARQLHGRTHLPYFFVDESNTSHIATAEGFDKESVDGRSAQLILEEFFSELYKIN